MDSDEIRVSLHSIEDFRDHLGSHLRQVASALSTLSRADSAALGHFYHARQTEHRYDELHAEFLSRVRRLLTAMVVSQAGTKSILAAYRNDTELVRARLHAITDALVRSDAVQRDSVLNDAVLRDAGLNATVFQDAALYEATLPPAAQRTATGDSTVVVGSGQTSA